MVLPAYISVILWYVAVSGGSAGILILCVWLGYVMRRHDDQADAIDFEAAARRIPVRQEARRRRTLLICSPAATCHGRTIFRDIQLSHR